MCKNAHLGSKYILHNFTSNVKLLYKKDCVKSLWVSLPIPEWLSKMIIKCCNRDSNDVENVTCLPT